MHSYLMSVFTALLFITLTPGLLLTLPSKTSSKIVAAVVHGLIFALIYHFTHKAVWEVLHKYEGFQGIYGGVAPTIVNGIKTCKKGMIKYYGSKSKGPDDFACWSTSGR